MVSDFACHKELLLKERICSLSLWEQILSLKRSSHNEKGLIWREILLEPVLAVVYLPIGSVLPEPSLLAHTKYSKTCVKRPLSKRPKIGFQYQLSLNAGQKYCRMLQTEHSAIFSTFNELPFVIKIFVLSFFEWPFKIGFTVLR